MKKKPNRKQRKKMKKKVARSNNNDLKAVEDTEVKKEHEKSNPLRRSTRNSGSNPPDVPSTPSPPRTQTKKRKSRKISSNSSVLAIIPENNSIHSEFNPSALKDSTTTLGMETRSTKKLKRTGMNGLDPDETPKKKTKKKQKKK